MVDTEGKGREKKDRGRERERGTDTVSRENLNRARKCLSTLGMARVRGGRAPLVFFGGIKILLAARPSDFKILIGRGEGSWSGGRVVWGKGEDPASVENRVWRVRAGSPETTQRFQIADPISVHV